jgi:hypothetical protein
MDRDIQNGLNTAVSLFNPALFDTSPIGTPPNLTSESLNAYLYLAAHFLVTALQTVGGLSIKAGVGSPGLRSQGEGIVSNKSAGGVSVGYVWPSTVTDNAALFQLTKTQYGQTYLQILLPRLVGNVSAVFGESADNSEVFPPSGGQGITGF